MSGLPTGPLKIVVLGEGRAGKTSLLRRFVHGRFDENEESTRQAQAYMDKSLAMRGAQVQLALWDTAGQERYHSLAPIYYRDADGALLVYDITDSERFRRVAKWVEELRAMGPKCPVAIVGNKADLNGQAQVLIQDAEAYALSIRARHGVASAKSGAGVQENFEQLVGEALDWRGPRQAARGGPARRGGAPVVEGSFLLRPGEEDEARPAKRCCSNRGAG